MRGPHPGDTEFFAPPALLRLRDAARDLRYLLGRGYARPSAVQLVGDKFQLARRQRQVLARAVNDPAVAAAIRARVRPHLRDAHVAIDTYNVLITVETAL